jgi:urea transport system permease protein
LLISQIINGLSSAGLLLLAALGAVIIFGNMGIINLAHGDLIMTGAYTTVFFSEQGIPFGVCVVLSFITAAVVGLLIEITVIRRFYGQLNNTLLASYAVSIILGQSAKLIFGPATRTIPPAIAGSLVIGGVYIPYYNILIVAIALLTAFLTWALLYRTTLGLKIRAISQNRRMTECLRVDTAKIDTFTFALGSGLAGVAGAVIVPARVATPLMGASYLLDSFITVVVGGFDSLLGAGASAALISEFTSVLGGFVSEVAAKIILLLLVIVLIRFRPRGLFAKEGR